MALDFSAPPPRRRRAGALRHHHVRAHQRVEEALAGERRAESQGERIIAWFRGRDAANPGARFAPSEVHAALGGDSWAPIQSVRRSMTNLTNEEPPRLVQHQADRRPGPWGSTEGTWSLAPAGRA
jgi:hypothetical protein